MLAVNGHLALVEPADSTVETERPPKPKRARRPRKPRVAEPPASWFLPEPTHRVLMTVESGRDVRGEVNIWNFAATSADDADRKFRDTIPERYQAQCRVVPL